MWSEIIAPIGWVWVNGQEWVALPYLSMICRLLIFANFGLGSTYVTISVVQGDNTLKNHRNYIPHPKNLFFLYSRFSLANTTKTNVHVCHCHRRHVSKSNFLIYRKALKFNNFPKVLGPNTTKQSPCTPPH